MGIIQEMLTQDHEKKQTIDRKVSEQHILPTQVEQQKANDVIRIISEKYADKLKDHSIQEIENELIEAIREECESLNLSYEEQKRIEKTVIVTALGQGPIEEYLRDPTVTEIVVQRYDNVVIERNGKIESVKAVFFSEDHLVNTIERIEDESGMEIIQAVFLVGISAALAVIMIKLFGTMSDGMANTQEKVKNAFTDVNGL